MKLLTNKFDLLGYKTDNWFSFKIDRRYPRSYIQYELTFFKYKVILYINKELQ